MEHASMRVKDEKHTCMQLAYCIFRNIIIVLLRALIVFFLAMNIVSIKVTIIVLFVLLILRFATVQSNLLLQSHFPIIKQLISVANLKRRKCRKNHMDTANQLSYHLP